MNIHNILDASKRLIEDQFGIHVRRQVNRTIPNEAINVTKKVVFVAVPKTGSTSVRSQTREVGKSILYHPHLNYVQLRDVFYIYQLRAHLRKNHDYPTTGILTDEAFRKASEETFNSYFKFAGVRNPWARAVSLYSRREDVRLREKMTFEEFCEQHFYASDTCRNCTLHKNQYDWLCDEKGINQMDYVYKLEDFDQAIQDVRELTNGRINLERVNRNRNPSSKSRTYQNMYNDKCRNIIATRFEKDIDTFKFTF